MKMKQWIELCKVVVEADTSLTDIEQELAVLRGSMRHLHEHRRRIRETLTGATELIHQHQLELDDLSDADPAAAQVPWARGKRPTRTRSTGDVEAFFRAKSYTHHAGVLRLGTFTEDPFGVWLTEEEAGPVRARAYAAKKGPLPPEMKVAGDNGA